jgi:glycosyltransferase involved in cell wall biosynthesis
MLTPIHPEKSRNKLPGIDVVIPTLNCESKLRRCLSRIRAQTYAGEIKILVVDGGSSDHTPAVAEEFGATVFVNPGQYLAGLNGARHFGECKGVNPLVWNVDADNFLVEDTCATDLALPLVEFPLLDFTFPGMAIDTRDSRFNNYLALDEQLQLERLKAECHPQGNIFVTEDCPYGLTNVTLIRREVLEKVGGYDSDVLVLRRLRSRGLAHAALVPTAHFTHAQTSGPLDYRKKWVRRVRHYAAMAPAAREGYFSGMNVVGPNSDPLMSQSRRVLSEVPKNAVLGFVRSGDSTWLNGLILMTIVLSIGLTHPWLTHRAFDNFLKGATGVNSDMHQR